MAKALYWVIAQRVNRFLVRGSWKGVIDKGTCSCPSGGKMVHGNCPRVVVPRMVARIYIRYSPSYVYIYIHYIYMYIYIMYIYIYIMYIYIHIYI